MIKGIDVSYYQGNIDWNKVKNDGISFVIIRDGYGKTTDSKFYSYAQGAKESGVSVKGIYHFSYALNIQEAINEANLAVENATKAGLSKDTIIFFDLEYDSVEWGKKNGLTIGKKTCTEFTEAFCNEVTKLGYRTGIYANQDYLNRMYDTDLIKKYPLWLADWTGMGQRNNCLIRQFSEKGTVNGIIGYVDMNEWFGEFTNTVPEIQNEKKTNEEIANEVIAGLWGNGEDRKKRLAAAGYSYNEVQSIVNEKVKTSTNTTVVDSKIVDDVILGLYGNGEDRKKRLTAAGYSYDEVQSAVNKKLNQSKVTTAKKYDRSIAGAYRVTAHALNCRYIPGIMTQNNICKIFYKDSTVICLSLIHI